MAGGGRARRSSESLGPKSGLFEGNTRLSAHTRTQLTSSPPPARSLPQLALAQRFERVSKKFLVRTAVEFRNEAQGRLAGLLERKPIFVGGRAGGVGRRTRSSKFSKVSRTSKVFACSRRPCGSELPKSAAFRQSRCFRQTWCRKGMSVSGEERTSIKILELRSELRESCSFTGSMHSEIHQKDESFGLLESGSREPKQPHRASSFLSQGFWCNS